MKENGVSGYHRLYNHVTSWLTAGGIDENYLRSHIAGRHFCGARKRNNILQGSPEALHDRTSWPIRTIATHREKQIWAFQRRNYCPRPQWARCHHWLSTINEIPAVPPKTKDFHWYWSDFTENWQKKFRSILPFGRSSIGPGWLKEMGMRFEQTWPARVLAPPARQSILPNANVSWALVWETVLRT